MASNLKARLDILAEWVAAVKKSEEPEPRNIIFELLHGPLTEEEMLEARPLAIEVLGILMGEDEGLHYPTAICDALASKFRIDLVPYAKSDFHKAILERMMEGIRQGWEPPKSNAQILKEARANLEKEIANGTNS